MLSRLEIAERVESRRLRMGLTQEALAELADVSRGTINRIEQATISPTLDTICKVAEALGTTGPAMIAEQPSVELMELVQALPAREQEIACVLLRALSEHVSAP